jgi:alpha-mannosidase
VENGGKPAGYFKYAAEDASKGMTAWNCGHYMREEPLLSPSIAHYEYKKDGLVKRFKYSHKFGASDLSADVTLRDGCDFLEYKVNVNFREFGNRMETPALLFTLKTDEKARSLCDVAYGLLEREAADDDRPSLSLVCADAGGGAAVLSADSKYGFRNYGGETSVNLIRATSDPDPAPEAGGHEYRICVGAHTFTTAKDLLEKAETYYKPVDAVSVAPGKGGRLPHTVALFAHKGGAVLSSVKPAEDGDGVIFRFYGADGRAGKNTLEFTQKIAGAELCGGCENGLSALPARNGKVEFDAPAYGVVALRVKF